MGAGPQRVWGQKSPSWVQGQSPSCDLGAKPPEARYMPTICSGQTHFRDVFIENIRCTFRLMQSLLPPPYSSKTLRIYANLTIHPGRGRVGTCPSVPHRGYATAARSQRQVLFFQWQGIGPARTWRSAATAPQPVTLTGTRNKEQIIEFIVSELTKKVQDCKHPTSLLITGKSPVPVEIKSSSTVMCQDLQATHEEADVIIPQQVMHLIGCGCSCV